MSRHRTHRLAALLAPTLLLLASPAAAEPPEEGPAPSVLAPLLLGPWAEGLIFDLNANLPVLDLDTLDFKVFGDVLLGLQGDQFGVVARGGITAWDLAGDVEVADTTAPEGELDLWYTSASAPWRWEARTQLRVARYDTTVIRADGANPDLFRDETALMLRAHGLAGLRYTEGDAAFAVWLGAGVQHESFSLLTVSPFAEVQTLDRDDDALILNARLRGQLPMLDGALVLRGRADVLTHTLTRSVRLNPVAPPALTRADQLEANARLFFDLELLRVWGFVPSANLGLDAVVQSAGTTMTFVAPSIGVGVRRVAF